ncbi:hypothetical protein EV193_101152 [Herbihabitans rhizosphaerae]|uniref:NUDIX domain-containing protein n=1 Tax=Herbihabitans rhizosphaerae TaxID=1872711 RepID=A0A4Q7L4S0_9PSEU|nr:hypothetical protein [Herbihabitans rhizosphaerae]RZS44277.1 hypothetical protein EV193_101152 [Herbihabitans rhizosphaerae]
MSRHVRAVGLVNVVDEQAPHREVTEELGVGLRTARFRRTYRAPAYGEGDGATVELVCYDGELDGEPAPGAEIAALRRVTASEYGGDRETAPAIHLLLRDLLLDGVLIK